MSENVHFSRVLSALTKGLDAHDKAIEARDTANAERNEAIAAASTPEDDAKARKMKIPDVPEFKAVATRPGIPGSGILLGRDVNSEVQVYVLDPAKCLTEWPLKAEDLLARDWELL